jgi:signal transduction histidine kinase
MHDEPADPVALLRQLRSQHQDLLRRMQDNQGDFQRLARSVYRVQEEERGRIARELHDGIGQNLTALKHQFALIAAQLEPDQDALRERMDAGIALCAQTLEDTRVLSRLLRPQVLDDLGLESALQWLSRTLGEAGGLHVELDLATPPMLDPDLQTVVFRIAQEALGNVVRHARASNATVRLDALGNWLQLVIEDDGTGFDVVTALAAGSAGHSAGLTGMRDRARLYGGELHIESSPGRTRLQIAFPLAAQTATLGT